MGDAGAEGFGEGMTVACPTSRGVGGGFGDEWGGGAVAVATATISGWTGGGGSCGEARAVEAVIDCLRLLALGVCGCVGGWEGGCGVGC